MPSLEHGHPVPQSSFKNDKSDALRGRRVKLADFPCAGCEGGTRRGLAAAVSIAEGDDIVSAEWRAVLSTEHSMGELAEAVAMIPDLTAKELLALKILYHRFLPGSPLTLYVCSLPAKVGTPIEWGDAQVDRRFAKLTDMAVRVKSAKLYLVQEYNRIFPLLFARLPGMFAPSIHTPEAWVWAMQTVKSRNWNVDRKREPKITTAMVPLVDMINHAMGAKGAARSNLDGSRFTVSAHESLRITKNNRDELHEKFRTAQPLSDRWGCAVPLGLCGPLPTSILLERRAHAFPSQIVAHRKYNVGDEVFTSYGDDCNLYYLLTYGFEVEGNEHECVKVKPPHASLSGFKPGER